MAAILVRESVSCTEEHEVVVHPVDRDVYEMRALDQKPAYRASGRLEWTIGIVGPGDPQRKPFGTNCARPRAIELTNEDLGPIRHRSSIQQLLLGDFIEEKERPAAAVLDIVPAISMRMSCAQPWVLAMLARPVALHRAQVLPQLMDFRSNAVPPQLDTERMAIARPVVLRSCRLHAFLALFHHARVSHHSGSRIRPKERQIGIPRCRLYSVGLRGYLGAVGVEKIDVMKRVRPPSQKLLKRVRINDRTA